MRLSHLADYAVVLMTAAARRDAGARLSATELSGETGVPLPTAQKLMGQLAASGLLSSVRGAGRLSGWEQRACTLTGARRHLAASPPAWADFANHNAELAIRLATGPAAPRPARPPRPAAAG